MQHLSKAATIQTKLEISWPGDPYEQEADQVAGQLMHTLDSAVRVRRQCAGGGYELGGECEECRQGWMALQPGPTDQAEPDNVPLIIDPVRRSSGQPLDPHTRAFMEPRFGYDFSQVRVHTDTKAAESAQAVIALAYTAGKDIVFGAGQYAPHTATGCRLIAHELTHTVQQGVGARALSRTSAKRLTAPNDASSKREAGHADLRLKMRHGAHEVYAGSAVPLLQRQPRGQTSPTIRSPLFEETVTQASDIVGGMTGRSLTRGERDLARPIFGASIDYDRVRLISLSILEYRTVGNNIYIPENFTVSDAYMAQTLIHELTHVWQYQHTGTSYISESLGAQIAAEITRGSRNFAYDYQIQPNQTFFDFNPEQQGLIVENYFTMLRDQQAIPTDQAAGRVRTYNSNHLGTDGFPVQLSAADRLAQINRELPLHEPLISQMRAALPRSEVDLLNMRAIDVVRTPGEELSPVPEEHRIVPLRPIFEVRF